MDRIKHSIEEVIGHTPILELDGLEKQEHIDAHILVKLENLNPFGSLKDRIAMAMIDALERDTDIQPGDTIVEFSSGNTAIGLAALASKRGYKMLAYMVQATEERIKLLEAYGATVRDMTQDEGVMEVIAFEPMDDDVDSLVGVHSISMTPKNMFPQIILRRGRVLYDKTYERIKPEKVAPDFGYATGSAGIAAALLQMYQFQKKEIHFIRYIDDPYPTNVTLK